MRFKRVPVLGFLSIQTISSSYFARIGDLRFDLRGSHPLADFASPTPVALLFLIGDARGIVVEPSPTDLYGLGAWMLIFPVHQFSNIHAHCFQSRCSLMEFNRKFQQFKGRFNIHYWIREPLQPNAKYNIRSRKAFLFQPLKDLSCTLKCDGVSIDSTDVWVKFFETEFIDLSTKDFP